MNIETYYFDYSRQELCTVSQQVVVVATAADSQGQRFNAQILGVSWTLATDQQYLKV